MENITEPKPGHDKKLWEKCAAVAVFPFLLLPFGGFLYKLDMDIIESVVGLSALLLSILLVKSEKFNNFGWRAAKIDDPLIDILYGICQLLLLGLMVFMGCVVIHYGNFFYGIEPIVPDWIQAKTSDQQQCLLIIALLITMDITALLTILCGDLKLKRANQSYPSAR